MANLIWFIDVNDLVWNVNPDTLETDPVPEIQTPGNQWAGPAHVFLDGVDITKRCFRMERYDDGTEFADCYVIDPEDGSFKLTDDQRGLATELLSGKIEVIPFTDEERAR